MTYGPINPETMKPTPIKLVTDTNICSWYEYLKTEALTQVHLSNAGEARAQVRIHAIELEIVRRFLLIPHHLG